MKRTLRFVLVLVALLTAVFATQSALTGGCIDVMPGIADPCRD